MSTDKNIKNGETKPDGYTLLPTVFSSIEEACGNIRTVKNSKVEELPWLFV